MNSSPGFTIKRDTGIRRYTKEMTTISRILKINPAKIIADANLAIVIKTNDLVSSSAPNKMYRTKKAILAITMYADM
jgi:hypothetical protein